MRYVLDTKVPRNIKEYSKPIAKEYLNYLVDNGIVTNFTNSRLQICVVAVSVFIYNSYLHAVSNKKKFPIPLDRNVYSKGFIINGKPEKDKVSYEYTRNLIDYMQTIGKITYELGKREWMSYEVFGKYKTMTEDTVTVVHMIDDFYKEMKTLKTAVGYVQKRSVISLRDEKGYPVAFTPTSYQSYIRKVVNNINGEALSAPIGKVNDEDFDTRMQLEKIWNVTKERGGRMYTSELQSMPKAERKLLTLYKDPVVCLDYKCFETSLLYTMVGEKMQGDPYQIHIKGYDDELLRTIGKMVMTRIYYAKNEFELRASINFDIANDYDLDKLVVEGKIPSHRIPVAYVVNELMKQHDCVSDYFFKKGDVDPANLGSLVIDYIMDYMIQNHSEVVIPVYDEIICRQQFEDIVRCVMKEAYIHVVGSDMNCKIEKA